MIENVLCIDNNESSSYYKNTILKGSSFINEVDFINEGNKVFEYFQNLINNFEMVYYKIPDLILLDLKMHGLNGWAFIEEFSKKYANVFPSTKILITSASNNHSDLLRSKSYPFIIDCINQRLTTNVLQNINEIYFSDYSKNYILA